MDAVAEMKFKSIKKSAVKLGSNKSFRVKKEIIEKDDKRAKLKRGLRRRQAWP